MQNLSGIKSDYFYRKQDSLTLLLWDIQQMTITPWWNLVLDANSECAKVIISNRHDCAVNSKPQIGCHKTINSIVPLH